MSRVLEALLDMVFTVMNIFDSITTRRDDDELTAEFKAKQRACLFSIASLTVVAVLWRTATSILDVAAGLVGGAAAAATAGTRQTVGMGLAGLSALATAYVLYCFGSLFLFARENGMF